MDISVIGLGSWGTALALHLHKRGQDVILYGRLEDQFEEISMSRKHPFLPGLTIPEGIRMTNDLTEACRNEFLVLAVPSPFVRGVMEKVVTVSIGKKNIINVAKGFEIESGKRISEVVSEVAGESYGYCILSGPTHAEEVARELPAAIVAASNDLELALSVQQLFSDETLRVYTSRDTIGVEVGGSFKNVVAIAAGIVDGLQFGDNAKAGLITRGLYEMKRLGKALGAEGDTFNGLTGVGDLIVTCMSRHSRNRGFGERIGRGEKSSDILKDMKMVTEGVFAAKAFHRLNEKLGLSLPITDEVYKTIYEDKDPVQCFKDLMSREMKMESEH